VVGGRIELTGRDGITHDLRALSSRQMRDMRGNRIAMIFQDPMMTLNPVLRVDTQMIEAVRAHQRVSHDQARDMARAALAKVGIPSPDERLTAYPHQFSGGMRQRVAIAIALLNKPDLIIADEPTTALDVTIQGQILAEVQALCRESGTALIWITHDLSVVAGLADSVCVMYAGRIVEQGSVQQVLEAPRHPYTFGLIASAPSRNPRGARLRLPRALRLRHRGLQADAHARRARRRPRATLLPPRDQSTNPRPRGDRRMNAMHPEHDAAAAADVSSPAPLVPILSLQGMSKRFVKGLDISSHIANWFGSGLTDEVVHAVDHVDLDIATGEVVGLVGESGCGKSTLGRLAVGLHKPTTGTRLWKGVDLDRLPPERRREKQLAIQMIFQDPYASLNPRMRVQDIVGEAPVVHGMVDAAAQRDYVADMLTRVGLDPSVIRRFPHQFSGGQRARIGIARALAVKPEFLVCDESVAALDVSIQAQVLNLFIRLREQLNLTYLFISHDLGVVKHVSDRVVIMYLGRVVESAPTEAIFASPNHPYTQALLAEAPKLEVRKKTYVAISGEIPSPLHPPTGCHFHPRCPHAMPRCKTEQPVLKEIAPLRFSACHLNDQP
jgi:peptide/nickel transport system ATP-binding protein